MREGREMTLRQRAMLHILILGMMDGKDFFDADFGNRKGASLKEGHPCYNVEGKNQHTQEVAE